MRIAVSGTHRIGKSTLVEEFAGAHADYEIEPEPYEQLLEGGDDFLDPCDPDAFVVQLEHLVTRLSRGTRMKELRQWVRYTTLAALVLGCGQPPEDAPDLGSRDDSGAPRTRVEDSVTPPSPAPDSVLTPDGWDDLRMGMTRAQVVAAAGEDAHPEAVGGPDPASCDEFRPSRAPDGLLVMIRNGRLARISITGNTGIATSEGIAVGDSAAAVRRAYGSEAVSSPHAFHAAPAEYLTVWRVRPPSPSARGVVYEITGSGRVLRILAGDESIRYREGCV